MTIRWVEPGILRLPASRPDVDLIKLAEQYRRFGDSVAGMPPIELTEGAGGEFMISDGVTRATRIHRYAPRGTTVPAIVIEVRPKMVMKHLPKVT